MSEQKNTVDEKGTTSAKCSMSDYGLVGSIKCPKDSLDQPRDRKRYSW